jgi:hypothetical protein
LLPPCKAREDYKPSWIVVRGNFCYLEVQWDLGWDFEEDPNWDLCLYPGVASSNGLSKIVDLMGLEAAPFALNPLHPFCHLKV